METRKEKFIKILKRLGMVLSIGFNVVFLIAIIIGFSGSKKQSNKVNVACAESEGINFEFQNKKMITYQDDFYSIILNDIELNNYVWENVSTIFEGTEFSLNDLILSYNYSDSDFTYSSVEGGYYGENENTGDAILISFPTTPSYKFIYGIDEEGIDVYVPSVFPSGSLITLDFTDCNPGAYWNQYKSAFELDIQANSGNINDGIFVTMTDSIVAFISSLSSGISAMVGVFYDSVEGNLTAIGLLSVIVVAISLCYFLFRLIIGLIRMRG